MSEEQKKELEKIKELHKQAQEAVNPYVRDLEANDRVKGSSVYYVNNAWVVKPHSFSPGGQQ